MKEHREQTGVTDATTYVQIELGTVESYALLCYVCFYKETSPK